LVTALAHAGLSTRVRTYLISPIKSTTLREEYTKHTKNYYTTSFI